MYVIEANHSVACDLRSEMVGFVCKFYNGLNLGVYIQLIQSPPRS